MQSTCNLHSRALQAGAAAASQDNAAALGDGHSVFCCGARGAEAAADRAELFRRGNDVHPRLDSVQPVRNQRGPADGNRAPAQALVASQADRSAWPWKSSRATPEEKASPTARASSCSSGSAWIWAVVTPARGPQRRLSGGGSWLQPHLADLPGGLPDGVLGGLLRASLAPPVYGAALPLGCQRSP